MFNPRQDEPQDGRVSYDLGWLLENGQVSEESFCAFLFTEISPEIERLVSRFIKSPADRIAAVDQILFSVLLRRDRYKSAVSGKAWLYQIIFQTCLERMPGRPFQRANLAWILKRIDTHLAAQDHFSPFLNALTERQRLFAILYYGQNLSIEDIAAVLPAAQEPLQDEVKQVSQLLIAYQHACKDCLTLHNSLKGLETALLEDLQAPDLWMETARANSPDWAQSLLSRVSREKKTRRAWKWAGHALEAALVSIFVLLGVWGATHTGQIQTWSSQPTQSTILVETSLGPAPKPAPSATPLPSSIVSFTDQDAEEVFILAQTSWARWRSLWANVEVKTYFPETFYAGAGNPSWKFSRKQVWLSLPGSTRVISGESPNRPDLTYTIANERLSAQDFLSGEVIESREQALIPDADLRKLFSPVDMFDPGGKYSQKGADTVAGRAAWVLDWERGGRRVYRFWIDQQDGVVLRRIEFAEGNPQYILSDIQVTRIFFDADFPGALFEAFRYKGNFYASDFSGSPEISDLRTALQSTLFLGRRIQPVASVPSTQRDLASARLSIKNVPAGWMQSPDGPGLELYADQFDLGKLLLGGKSVMACRRSPDGMRIAYNSPPQGASKNTFLMLADLSSLQSVQPALIGGITSGDFAFSPDNHKLAFFGCEKASGFCGIFILDIPSGTLTRLMPLTFADTISWSPDGRSLALVGSIDRSKEAKKMSSANLLMNELMALSNIWFYEVVDSDSGDITFKQPFSWSDLSVPADSPTLAWDKSFEIPSAGFLACASPPGLANSSVRGFALFNEAASRSFDR